MPIEPVVLYEDNHLLVVDKPPGMSTQGALPGAPSAVEWAKSYLKRRYAKPGNVFVGVVSRLDRDVSGVLVLARTSKAAARLSEQFRNRSTEKIYWAVVDGAPPPTFACVDWLLAAERLPRVQVVAADVAGAGEARLRGRTLRRAGRGTLVEVTLETGRKHQIRAQLASRGWPIVGDRRYGSQRRFAAGIALHARRLTLEHPTRRESLSFEAPPPKSWRELGVDERYPG